MRCTGNWRCLECSASCFGSKCTCFQCGALRRGIVPSDLVSQWRCCSCRFFNFENRSSCYGCHLPRLDALILNICMYGAFRDKGIPTIRPTSFKERTSLSNHQSHGQGHCPKELPSLEGGDHLRKVLKSRQCSFAMITLMSWCLQGGQPND